DLKASAVRPSDPIEAMLIEQITFAHLRTAQLQAEAAMAVAQESRVRLNAAAARMLAEFRSTVLALKSYREPRPGQTPTESAPSLTERPGSEPAPAQQTGE